MIAEDDLHAYFTRSVESVVPDPEPYQRLLRRRRRSQLHRAVAAGGLAAVLVAGVVALPGVLPGASGTAGPAPLVSSDQSVGYPGEPIASDWTRRLIASPTRGRLSADYVRSVAKTAQEERGALGIAPDLTDVAVLFVDDVGTARVGLVAFYSTARVTMMWYAAAKGASAAQLLSGPPVAGQLAKYGGLAMLDDKGTASQKDHPGSVNLDVLVGLAPSDCRIDTAADAAHRRWVPEPTGSYLVGAEARSAEWWRVTCSGTPRYQGPVRAAGSYAGAEISEADLDAAIVGSRGTVERPGARMALNALVEARTVPSGPARVLWGGTLRGSTGTASPAVVAAARAPGGGWLVAAWWWSDTNDAPPPAAITGTNANLASPDMLFAARPGGASSPLVVIGPQSAATVTASVDGRKVAQAALYDGIGQLTIGSGDQVTVQALDTHGRPIASYVVGHHAGDPDPNPNPVVDSW